MGIKISLPSWLTGSKKIELKATPAAKSGSGRQKARQVIKKQAGRKVSYQIADLNSAIQLAKNPETPDRSKLFAIFEYVLKDTRLKSQIRDAVMKVTGEPFMLYNESEQPDEELTKKFYKRWFRLIIKNIVLAEMMGYRVVEADRIDASTFSIGDIEPIPNEHVSIERQWILIDGNINGAYLPYGEIAWEIDLLEFGSKTDFGLLLEAAYNIIYKYYARTDWSRANEKVGAPILAIIADTVDDTELDNYETKAANFGTDGYIVGQKGDDIKLIERQGQRMHDTFYDMIKLANEEVTLHINGQTATTDQKSFVGSAEVQERKFEDLTIDRLQNVADEVNEKVLPYLRAKGFAIPEGYTFNYPAVLRDRDKKLKGETTATDPKEQPKEEEVEKDKKKKKPQPTKAKE